MVPDAFLSNAGNLTWARLRPTHPKAKGLYLSRSAGRDAVQFAYTYVCVSPLPSAIDVIHSLCATRRLGSKVGRNLQQPLYSVVPLFGKMSEAKKFSVGGYHKTVAEEPVTSVLSKGEVPMFDRELTADEEVLAALGYKPEFKREFSLWTTFCVSFAVLGLLPSFASTLYYVGFFRLSSSVVDIEC